MTRARKGLLAIRDVKTNPYKLLSALILNHKKEIGILTDKITYHKSSEFPICDRYQTGSTITKDKIKNVFVSADLLTSKDLENGIENKEIDKPKEDISLEKIDKQILTIDDFLDDFDK